jgi:hypothetical protein
VGCQRAELGRQFQRAGVNLDPTDQGSYDIPLAREVEFIETITNFGCELIKPAYNEGKLV